MNHDCKENTCPFYAEHQNAVARRHASMDSNLRGFRAVVKILTGFALERVARATTYGEDCTVPYSSIFMRPVASIDPQLMTLMQNVNNAQRELDQYILKRTVKG